MRLFWTPPGKFSVSRSGPTHSIEHHSVRYSFQFFNHTLAQIFIVLGDVFFKVSFIYIIPSVQYPSVPKTRGWQKRYDHMLLCWYTFIGMSGSSLDGGLPKCSGSSRQKRTDGQSVSPWPAGELSTPLRWTTSPRFYSHIWNFSSHLYCHSFSLLLCQLLKSQTS